MKIWGSKNILGMVIFAWECEFVVGSVRFVKICENLQNPAPAKISRKTLDGFPTLC